MGDSDLTIDGWNASDADRYRRRRWAATTPEERLRWLERAIRFAGSVGTLPRPRPEAAPRYAANPVDPPQPTPHQPP